MRKHQLLALSLAAVMGCSMPAFAQVAGRATLGVSVEETQAILKGWSVKKSILGQAVYNEQNQKIGEIYDLIIAPDREVSFAIISTGGFLGIAKHDVAIPVGHFDVKDNHLILPGASKEALRQLPAFEYEKMPSKLNPLHRHKS
jgi:sporulation protein YlmC with PRC-barrel domain